MRVQVVKQMGTAEARRRRGDKIDSFQAERGNEEL
jgi:hypothetical protein